MDEIKALRDMTGISVMQCKKALEEAQGDQEKALLILRKKGAESASKKADRELRAGVVSAYVHNNHALGTMIELSCETDFVAKNDEYKALAYDIAMHATAMHPRYIGEKDITDEDRAKVLDLFRKEVEESGKPADIQEKMLKGKVDTYFGEQTLLAQLFVKDDSRTVKEVIDAATQKFGERIEVRRIVRFAVSE